MSLHIQTSAAQRINFCNDAGLNRGNATIYLHRSGPLLEFENGLEAISCCRANFRQEKRAQRLTFWVRRPPGGVEVFLAKGWWPKTSCSPSKVCLPWVSKRGIWAGNFAGPGHLGGVEKFVLEKFVRIFRSLKFGCWGGIFGLLWGLRGFSSLLLTNGYSMLAQHCEPYYPQ